MRVKKPVDGARLLIDRRQDGGGQSGARLRVWATTDPEISFRKGIFLFRFVCFSYGIDDLVDFVHSCESAVQTEACHVELRHYFSSPGQYVLPVVLFNQARVCLVWFVILHHFSRILPNRYFSE